MDIKKNEKYIVAWNHVIEALKGKDDMMCNIHLESFIDAANRGLLYQKNVDACQAVLDCTGIFIETGILPNRL